MRQPDLFRRPVSGKTLRDEALERFQDRERTWIKRARQRMHDLLVEHHRMGRLDHEVCSDDVWMLCPPPADCHPSVMGPVFRGGVFVKVGWRASKRPSAHARMISTYRLRSE